MHEEWNKALSMRKTAIQEAQSVIREMIEEAEKSEAQDPATLDILKSLVDTQQFFNDSITDLYDKLVQLAEAVDTLSTKVDRLEKTEGKQ